jgi:hypothetical protein
MAAMSKSAWPILFRRRFAFKRSNWVASIADHQHGKCGHEALIFGKSMLRLLELGAIRSFEQERKSPLQNLDPHNGGDANVVSVCYLRA